MTISRVKSSGYAPNETMTSAQATQIDINVTNAVDKRTGNSDTVLSNLTISSPGSVVIDDFTMSSTNKVKLASRSITRVIDLPFVNADWTNWSLFASAGVLLTTSTGAAAINCPIHVPHGVTITSVTLNVAPGTAHVSAVTGASRGSIQLVRISAPAASTNIGSTVFAAGTFPGCNATHTIISSGLAEAVDRTANRYELVITPEGNTPGNGSINSWTPLSVSVTYTITAYDED